MKRIAGILAAVLGAVLVLVVLLVALVPREAVKAQIGQQIAGWTGRDVSLKGEPEISFFPTLSVTLNDVDVGGPADMPDADIISIARLTGTVRLMPLIIGRVEVDSFAIERPTIRLIRDAAGRRNWAFDAGAAALQLAFSGDVPLGVFDLKGGTIVYEDEKNGETERFDSVNVRIEWTSVRNPLAVEGSAIWRGEQVTFGVDAAAPFDFLNDAVTSVEARVESAPVSIVFTGEAQDYPLPQLNGALKLSTSSLRRFAGWLGNPTGPGATLGQASLFGTAEFRDGVLSVADAELTLDGNNASGALKVASGNVPDIVGTLAFDTLDLTPYFGGLSTTLSLTRDWRTVSLPTDWFDQVTADIRLSARSLTLGALTATSTAASASLRDGQLEIGVARAELEGGSLSGDLTVTGGARPAIEAQMRATDIDLASAGPAFDLPPAITGTGTAVVDLATGGGDFGALLDGLNGTVALDLQDGRIPLLGIATLAAESGIIADTGPIEALALVPVEAATAALRFDRGVALVEQANLTTASYVAAAKGRIGLHDGALNLIGTLQENAGVADNASFPFTIGGTLAQPTAELQRSLN